MRVLFTSIRSVGHFLPLVPFIEAGKRRGHEVAVAAPSDLRNRTAELGVPLFPFGHPGDEGLQPIWARLREAPSGRHVAVSEIFAGACVKAALPGLLETMERFEPDIVVRESQEYAGFIAAEKLGVPHVRVAITARRADMDMLAVAAPVVDGHARGIGMAPDPAGERFVRETSITFFPESLGGSEPGSAPVLRFRMVPRAPAPLPDSSREEGRPFVYATFGTTMGGMAGLRSGYRAALDAVRELPIRVLLTVGSDLPMDALGEVPSNVHVERFVPQDDVLPRAAAVLCHGGSGTVLGSLAFGVPLVVNPMFADQPGNAERVSAVGAGIGLPPRTASAVEIRAALARVLEESSFREAATRIAIEMRALPAVDEAPHELERLAGR